MEMSNLMQALVNDLVAQIAPKVADAVLEKLDLDELADRVADKVDWSDKVDSAEIAENIREDLDQDELVEKLAEKIDLSDAIAEYFNDNTFTIRA
jgi:hypothetical protein